MAARIRQAWRSLPTLGVELENKGSVARDHLASERTFLAWMRTSLALVSLGIAIAQLFKLPELIEPDTSSSGGGSNGRRRRRLLEGFTLQASTGTNDDVLTSDDDDLFSTLGSNKLASLERLGKPLGSLCIALGAICLLMGAYRYYVVQAHLMRGTFKPSRIEVSFMTLFVGAFVCAAFGIIVAVKLQG